MKKVFLLLTAAAIIILSCSKNTDENELIINETHLIQTEINVESILQNAELGDEVQQFVAMHADRNTKQFKSTGKADLTIIVDPGDEIIWKLTEKFNGHKLEITGFKFTVVEGGNFLEIDGGYLPVMQADKSWKARVSPDAKENSKLKYSVFFTIDGDEYWWDPFIKIRSGQGPG